MSTPDKNQSPTPVSAASQPDDASLQKIREILLAPTTRSIDDAQRTFESKLDEMRKQTGASTERMFKAQAETREWMERELESIRAALDHTLASFRAEFVDRQSMASLFSEMAFRAASPSGVPIDASRPDPDFEVVIDQRKKA